MAKAKKTETLNLDTVLFKCRDILRQARNSGSFFEKRDMMLTLVFLRFIGEIFSLGKKEFARAFEEVCAGLELQPVLGQKIQTLSKGYTRRTGIAAAMLHRPRLLVLDEPTEGLDPNQKTAVRKYLRRCAEKALVLISTHLLEEAEMLNSRVLLLADGTICRDTTVEGLRACSRDGTLADAFHRLTAEEKTATEDEQ